MKKMMEAGGGHAGNPADVPGKEVRIELIKRKVNQFIARCGRRPRVLVSHIGPCGQRKSLNQVAVRFAQWGFDVDIGSICQLPYKAALMAIENDDHMICILCDTDRISQIGEDVIDALQSHKSDDILVALFSDSYTGDSHCRVAKQRGGPVGMRPAEAEADIIAILDMLSH